MHRYEDLGFETSDDLIHRIERDQVLSAVDGQHENVDIPQKIDHCLVDGFVVTPMDDRDPRNFYSPNCVESAELLPIGLRMSTRDPDNVKRADLELAGEAQDLRPGRPWWLRASILAAIVIVMWMRDEPRFALISPGKS